MKLPSIFLLAASVQQVCSLSLDVTDPNSIRNASATIAYGLMNSYSNNQSGTAPTMIGTLPAPFYWWEAGAVWGGMVDYWAYTNDTSYNPTITQALLAQVGADNNYMPVTYYPSLGNDDQAFWALAALSALEYGFPDGPPGSPTWLSLAEAVFNTMVPRWGLGGCGGGLKWQIFSSNLGYDYKNSVSNGAFFQISARLARYTGNATYSEWAGRVWDWSRAIGLVDADYRVYDGTDDTINCTRLDHDQWTYEPALYIYGAAVMYNYTNASSTWQTHTTGLIRAANTTFFQPAFSNTTATTNIMYEPTCEPTGNCNNDQLSFKAYLARWLAKSTVLAPFTAPLIQPLLLASASAAAKACSGGDNGTVCGQKWYVDGFDGSTGIGQQLAALEVVQALLVGRAPGVATADGVVIQDAPPPSATADAPAVKSAAAASSPSPTKNAAGMRGVVAGVSVGFVAVLAVLLPLVGLDA